MSTETRPTRRDERRVQTIREIKSLAMAQVSQGGPDAVSLSAIVREMSMSPAAVYRYFASRDALLADLVVDAYDDLGDSLAALAAEEASAEDHLAAVLNGLRAWALKHPNSYRLIFHTSIGSGESFAVERTIPASSRSMSVLVEAIAAVARDGSGTMSSAPIGGELVAALERWRDGAGLDAYPIEVLALGFLSWTRLHGVISLELGGHLAATGIGGSALFETEVRTIVAQAGK